MICANFWLQSGRLCLKERESFGCLPKLWYFQNEIKSTWKRRWHCIWKDPKFLLLRHSLTWLFEKAFFAFESGAKIEVESYTCFDISPTLFFLTTEETNSSDSNVWFLTSQLVFGSCNKYLQAYCPVVIFSPDLFRFLLSF